MPRPRYFLSIALALWVLWAAIVLADMRHFETIEADASPESVAASLDAILARSMRKYGIAGAAAGAIIDGEIVWRARAGVRSPAGAPVTGRTAFNVGSVSKPLAAWAVMTLVEAGALELDAPVSAYIERWSLPESDHDRDLVTARRLLHHTAGLNIHGYGGYEPGDARPVDIVDLSEQEYPVRLVAAPGERRIYSGGGYSVLQILVEDVSGRGFDRYAQSALFEPLAMGDSAFDPARLEEVSAAFNAAGRAIHPLEQIAVAATGAYISGDDMERFLLAHVDRERLLDADSRQVLFGPEPVSGRFGASYTRGDTAEGPLLGHGGNNSTWHAQIYVRPEGGDGFYFLTNTTTGAQLGLELTCAWRSWAHAAPASEICGEERALVHTLSYAAAAAAAPALLLGAWLCAGITGGRRRIASRPRARGRGRLALRLLAAGVVALAAIGAWIVFYTETIYWRSGVVLIDELPLGELRWLQPAVLAGLCVGAVALWSSPRAD